MSYKGNREKVEADAERIVARLVAGTATLSGLMRRYRVAYPTLMGVLRPRMSASLLRKISHRARCRANRPTRFRKGHVPWSKGRKGIHLSPATEFQAGGLRGQAARNWRPMGTVTIRSDPHQRHKHRRTRRRFIKVADHGRLQDRWEPYARHLWRQAHGEIPPDCCVVHVDGDTMNDSLANLRLLTHRGHLALQIERNPEQLRLCRQRAGRAARRRHRVGRARARPLDTHRGMWDCAACGHRVEQASRAERCVKCGGSAWEQVVLRAAV